MIAVIAALECEKQALVDLLENKQEIETKLGKYTKGYIKDQEILVALCGVGKVAAAITACSIIENYDVEALINIGTAGGIKEEENVGDVLIADKLTYHDWDLSSFDGSMPSFASNQYVFYCDKALIEKAKSILEDVDHNVFIAPLVSGDSFVCSEDKVEYIQKYFSEAYGCEMEATSIAHVCDSYKIPCLIIRSFSDIVIKKDNNLDFEKYKVLASQRAAEFLKKYCEK